MYPESLMFFILLLSFQLRLDKPEKIKVRKAFGGHKKIKGIKVKTGLYVCNSLGKVVCYGDFLVQFWLMYAACL